MRSTRSRELAVNEGLPEDTPISRSRHRCPVMAADSIQNGEYQLIQTGNSYSPPQHYSKSRRMNEYATVLSYTDDDGFRPTPSHLHHHEHDHLHTTTGRMITCKSMPVFPFPEDILSTTSVSDTMCSTPLHATDACNANANHPLVRVDTGNLHKRLLESQTGDTDGIHIEDITSHEDMIISTATSLIHPSTLSNHEITPDTYVSHIFHYCLGYTPVHRSSLELLHSNYPSTSSVETIHSAHTSTGHCTSCFFSCVSESQTSHYCTELVEATRNGNLPLIRSLFASGKSLSSCNPFGESLLHMACRRGYTELVRFFIEEANVSPRRTDDGGRTPLHDALWHRDPQFDIVHILILQEPALLLCKDKRGFAPFSYSRAEHASLWIQFLWDRRDDLKTVLERIEIEHNCSDTQAVNENDNCESKSFRYKDIIHRFFQ